MARETDSRSAECAAKHTPLDSAARGVSSRARTRAAALPQHRAPAPSAPLPTPPTPRCQRGTRTSAHASTATAELTKPRSAAPKESKWEIMETWCMLQHSYPPQPLLPSLPFSYPLFSFTLMFPLRYLAWRKARFRPSFKAFQTPNFFL